MSYSQEMRNIWSNKPAKINSMSVLDYHDRKKRIKEIAKPESIKEFGKKKSR
jgi:hypothetical protein